MPFWLEFMPVPITSKQQSIKNFPKIHLQNIQNDDGLQNISDALIYSSTAEARLIRTKTQTSPN